MARRPPDPDQPVPLVLAPNDFEAQVISHALNAEGLRAVVVGSHGQVWYGGGNPLAPVSVMVRREDRLRALKLLRRLRAEAKGVELDDDTPLRAIDHRGRCVVCGYDMTGLEDSLICPECGTNLAEDEAIFEPLAGRSFLHSAAMRALIVLVILGCVLAAAIIGIEAIIPR